MTITRGICVNKTSCLLRQRSGLLTTLWTICARLPAAAKFSLIISDCFSSCVEFPPTPPSEFSSTDKLKNRLPASPHVTRDEGGLLIKLWKVCTTWQTTFRRSDFSINAEWLLASYRCLDVPCCAQHRQSTNRRSSLLTSSENNSLTFFFPRKERRLIAFMGNIWAFSKNCQGSAEK